MLSSRPISPALLEHTSGMEFPAPRAHDPTGGDPSWIRSDLDMPFAPSGPPLTSGISVLSAASPCRRAAVMATRKRVKRTSATASRIPLEERAPRLQEGAHPRMRPIRCGCCHLRPRRRTASTKTAARRSARSAWKNTRWESLWHGWNACASSTSRALSSGSSARRSALFIRCFSGHCVESVSY